MIEFRPLSDDHPNLAHSPLLRAALMTLPHHPKALVFTT
jgi:hypothetical protein